MTKDVEGQNSGDKETSSPREVQSSDRSAKQVPKGTADVHELITKLIAKPFDPARDITPEDIDDMKRQILFAADDERNFHWRSQRDACYTAAAMAIAGIDPALDATTFEWIAKYPGESDSEGISGIGRHMLLGIDHTRHLGTGKNTDVTIASLRHALKKYFSGWSFEKHRELFPIGPADTKDDMFLAADQAAEMKLVNVDPQLTPDQLKAISHYRETMKEKGQWETYTSIAANETLFGQKPDLSADDWVNILAAFRQDQGNSGQHYADHGFTMAGWIGDLTILGAHTVEIPPEGGLRIDGRRVGGKRGEIQE
ncbi:MAG TPA: hypothetical protein VJK52_02685 [Candidatus Nanoarchaeia archaeon]|nr:hypothetical protein [Candidatus Nanoarchaeia archaeon]